MFALANRSSIFLAVAAVSRHGRADDTVIGECFQGALRHCVVRATSSRHLLDTSDSEFSPLQACRLAPVAERRYRKTLGQIPSASQDYQDRRRHPGDMNRGPIVGASGCRRCCRARPPTQCGDSPFGSGSTLHLHYWALIQSNAPTATRFMFPTRLRLHRRG
jgi:hypothetical protein